MVPFFFTTTNTTTTTTTATITRFPFIKTTMLLSFLPYFYSKNVTTLRTHIYLTCVGSFCKESDPVLPNCHIRFTLVQHQKFPFLPHKLMVITEPMFFSVQNVTKLWYVCSHSFDVELLLFCFCPVLSFTSSLL